MKYYLTLFFTLLLGIVVHPVSAQRTVSVNGEYTYVGSENISIREARDIALERAKANAIEQAFGSILSSSSNLIMINKNGEAQTKMAYFGASDLKGEWIETESEEVSNPAFQDGNIFITAKVKGKAREIVNAKVEFRSYLHSDLYHTNIDKNAFINNEDIFLTFETPSDGYLAVYLLDEHAAQCLLPYSGDPDGVVKVKHGKEYTFFSGAKATKEYEEIYEEYRLSCKDESELNKVYIIFSPNEFHKAADHISEWETQKVHWPRELTHEEFQKWHTRLRSRDKEMSVECKTITISKK